MTNSDKGRRSFLRGGGSLLLVTTMAGCLDSLVDENDEQSVRSGIGDEHNYEFENPGSENITGPGGETEWNIGDGSGENDTNNPPSQDSQELGHLHGISGHTQPPAREGSIQRRFEWSAIGSNWWFEQNISRRLDAYYTARYGRSDKYTRYVSDWYGQSIIEGLVSEFERIGTEYSLSEREIVDLTMAFVQQLRYTPDTVETGFDQYTSYPVETLINRGGDCEDTTILLAAILREMGYGCVLIALWDTEPAHMGLGVKGASSIPGTYYEYRGDQYYFVETTGEGWQFGEMPEFSGSTQAEIMDITRSPTLVYEYETRMTDAGEIAVSATVQNVSEVSSTGPTLTASFEDIASFPRASAEASVGDELFFGGGEIDPVTLTLNPPDDRELRLKTTLKVGDAIHDTTESEWRSPV